MKINKIVLLIAIILGLITIFALNAYIKNIDTVEMATITYGEVIVANKTIPAHVRITEDMLKKASLPVEVIHPDSMKSMDKIIGGISRSEIISGEQILGGRIVTDEIQGTLSYRIPEDMRAISIPVNEISGVAGYISKGDKIDILVTYDDKEIVDVSTTYTVLQSIEVLEVGYIRAENGEPQLELVDSLTLLVNPSQAEVLAYANIHGTLHLSLRSPIDSNKVDLTQYNKDNLQSFRVR